MSSATQKQQTLWVLPPEADQKACEKIIQHFDLHPSITNILVNRGFTTEQAVDFFINPRLASLSDPFDLKDMDKAVDRIVTAIERQEKILIHGDYDADGITATALLCYFFKSCGIDHAYYLPHRLEDGYGVSLKCIDHCKKNNIDLFITLDCGIKAFEAVEYAAKLGIDVIITDHHESDDHIPNCVAVVDPKRKDCTSNMEELAGAGVAFKLIHALLKVGKQKKLKWSRGFDLKEYLDLVLIGTLADKVPLKTENRILLRHGLTAMQQTRKIGLQHLTKSAQNKNNKTALSMQDILFKVVPKINAAGRIDSANTSVDLLLTDDHMQGQELSYMLQELNQQRQRLERSVSQEIEQEIENNPEIKNSRLLVLFSPDWHIGVLGIVASRMCQKYNKGALLFQVRGDIAKASCRTPDNGLNLVELIESCSDIVEQFGGHEHAAGVTIKTEKLELFRKRINEAALTLSAKRPPAQTQIDAVVGFHQINNKLITDMNRLEPFGTDNPEPVFLTQRVQLAGPPFVIGGNHLKLKFMQNNLHLNAIAFGMAHRANELYGVSWLDILHMPSIDTYTSTPQIVLRLYDFKPSKS